MNYIEKAIKHGLDDGFHGRPRATEQDNHHDFPYYYFDDYYWAYRMGVLRKLNENPLERMIVTRTNECETCCKKGQPECPWNNNRIGNVYKKGEVAFILLCTEWEARE
jgi:hypothetical protein